MARQQLSEGFPVLHQLLVNSKSTVKSRSTNRKRLVIDRKVDLDASADKPQYSVIQTQPVHSSKLTINTRPVMTGDQQDVHFGLTNIIHPNLDTINSPTLLSNRNASPRSSEFPHLSPPPSGSSSSVSSTVASSPTCGGESARKSSVSSTGESSLGTEFNETFEQLTSFSMEHEDGSLELHDDFLRFLEHGRASSELEAYFNQIIQSHFNNQQDQSPHPSSSDQPSMPGLYCRGRRRSGAEAKALADEKRRRNNQASQRSRAINKARFEELNHELSRLERDNATLSIWLHDLDRVLSMSKQIFRKHINEQRQEVAATSSSSCSILGNKHSSSS